MLEVCVCDAFSVVYKTGIVEKLGTHENVFMLTELSIISSLAFIK